MPRHSKDAETDVGVQGRQPRLFEVEEFEADRLMGAEIVNVASVPQRSIFRYPGGKTWFVPYARKWLRALATKPAELLEPFAGGGIIGLTAAFEGLTERVILVERDPQVACVWHTLLSADALWLADQIAHFEFTPANIAQVLAHSAGSTRERAFQTILRNRVNRGGILAQGAGRVRTGEKGKGLASRWYPLTLRRRILDTYAIRDRIQFIEGDGLDIMAQRVASARTAFFIDPPYTAGGKRAGRRLYTFSDVDHGALFGLAAKLAGNFLMTYDNASDVQALAQQHGLEMRLVAMKNTHHAALTELIIARSLSWF